MDDMVNAHLTDLVLSDSEVTRLRPSDFLAGNVRTAQRISQEFGTE